MSLSDSMKKLKFDSRLTDYYLKYGELTQKELDQHLKSLDDVADNAETINIFDVEPDKEASQQSH